MQPIRSRLVSWLRGTRTWWLLALGLALLALSHVRFGVGVLAWVAPLPFLVALREREGWRFRVAFAGALVLGYSLAMSKIVTEPVPAALAFAFGAPIALVHLPAYLLWDRLVRRGRDGLAILAFAAVSSLAEWAQAERTPFGVWGAAPTSQVGSLPVLQLLALAGMPGLSFLIHGVAATIEAAWSRRVRWPAPAAVAAVVVVALAWGAARADRPSTGPEVRAATIRTEATFGGLPIPPDVERRRIDDTLVERTRAAAAAGATLVVWTEGATLVLPREEAAFRERAASVARAHRIELVVSYVMPIRVSPLLYENRARWYGPDGAERLAYLKHQPVPGEPAVAGAAPAPAFETSFGLATAAICYDYDFPAIARAHTRSGAGLVAVPSSDWRGIDPVHTEMAAMRAIEGGFSIVRSTRFGLSAGIDAYGRMRGRVSTNASREPFMLVSVPTAPVPTLYAALGNTVLAPLAVIVAVALYALFVRRGLRAPGAGTTQGVDDRDDTADRHGQPA